MIRRIVFVVQLLGLLLATQTAFPEDAKSRFPLGPSSWAGDRQLPNPYGIGATIYYQKQGYDLKDLSIELPDLSAILMSGVNPMAAIPLQIPGFNPLQGGKIDPALLGDADIDNHVTETDLKVDLWVLPFLNVYGLVGYLKGETEIDTRQLLGKKLSIDYDGPLYGAGATLVGGYKKVFASLSGAYIYADPSTSDTTMKSFIASPRLGFNVPDVISRMNLSFWVGAMYQHVQENDVGSIHEPPFGEIKYDVNLEQKDPWNYLAGIGMAFGEHWTSEIEGGVGDRKQIQVSATYRF